MANNSKPTLLSRSTARVLDALSEGEIGGLLNDAKSIYLNGTPLQDSGGSYNFEGVSYVERTGTATQSVGPGFVRGQTEISDGREIKKSTSITFTVSDADLDAVFLKISVPAIYEQTTKGKFKGTAVELAVDIRPNGGSYSQVGTIRIKGRNTSEYIRQKRIEIPEGNRPYTVRIRRITDDSTDALLQNKTYLKSYTRVYDWRLRYAYTALVGLKVDAEKFGSSFPPRIYEVAGLLIDYPSNYSPNTRVYTGVWDGTFTRGLPCDNPAWVIWDLCTKGRYGLGNVLTASGVDKWALYAIAQYCDELIPDGEGGTEPRFTFNGKIDTRDKALAWLDKISSVFRGMIFWGSNSLTFSQDRPAGIAKIVNRSNVLNGQFNYASTAKETRHSHVTVSYSDPEKLGDVNFEVVQRNNQLDRFGYNPTEVAALGCTSRAQARRVGEWLLDTEENEAESVTYKTGLDHATVRPGDLIQVFDPWYQGARLGGRVVAVAANKKSVTIDKSMTIGSGLTYYLRVTLPDGTIQERTLTNTAATNVTVLTFTTALPDTPIIGAVFGIANDDVNPRTFRVIANERSEEHIFSITAVLHDTTKYDRIERDLNLTKPDYTAYNTGRLAQPTALDITETKSDNGDEYAASAVLSWTPADDARVKSYGLQIWDGDDEGWQPEIIIKGTSFSYEQCPLGDLKFRVRSFSNDERYSRSAYVTSSTQTIIGYPDPTAYAALTVTAGFKKNVLTFAENTDPKFKRAIIYAATSNNFAAATIIGYAPSGDKKYTHENLGNSVARYYWIAPQDKYGRIGDRYPAGTTGIASTTSLISEPDTDAPTLAAPDDVTLIQDNVDLTTDGIAELSLVASCGAVAGAKSYEIAVYTASTLGGSKTQLDGIPSPSRKRRIYRAHPTKFYFCRCRAIDWLGNPGEWSDYTTGFQPSTDTTCDAPTSLTVSQQIKGALLTVSKSAESDFLRTRWFRSTVINDASPDEINAGAANVYLDTDVTAGQTYYYWAKHEDRTGNLSSRFPSGNGRSVTIRRVQNADVDPDTIDTDQIKARTVSTGGRLVIPKSRVSIKKGATLTNWTNTAQGVAVTNSDTQKASWQFKVINNNPSPVIITGRWGFLVIPTGPANSYTDGKYELSVWLTMERKKQGDSVWREINRFQSQVYKWGFSDPFFNLEFNETVAIQDLLLLASQAGTYYYRMRAYIRHKHGDNDFTNVSFFAYGSFDFSWGKR